MEWKGSSENELENMIKYLELPNYNGSYYIFELNKQKIKDGYYLILIRININEIGHLVGSCKKEKEVFYFDSFFAPVPKEIRKFCKGYRIYNCQSFDGIFPDKPIQKYNEDICGELVILFFLLCSLGYTFRDIIISLNK